MNTGLIIGFAAVLVVIFLASYFFNEELLEYEPVEFGMILEGPKYYGESDITGWHTINTGIFKIQTQKNSNFSGLEALTVL